MLNKNGAHDDSKIHKTRTMNCYQVKYGSTIYLDQIDEVTEIRAKNTCDEFLKTMNKKRLNPAKQPIQTQTNKNTNTKTNKEAVALALVPATTSRNGPTSKQDAEYISESSLIYEDDEKEVLCVAPPPKEIALIDLTRDSELFNRFIFIGGVQVPVGEGDEGEHGTIDVE